jgi:predicted ATP-grasp superfamily ATP-dependent carboligase
MRSEKTEEQSPAVLLGVNLQALKVARSLGRAGIKVYGIVSEKGRWEYSSRYITIRECQEPGKDGEFLFDYLIDLSREFDSRPVLIPMHDDHVLLVARYGDELTKYYRFAMANPAVMESLVSKSGLRNLARAHGFPQPATFAPRSLEDVRKLSGKVRYPALLKPEFSRKWQTDDAQEVVAGKVVVVQSDSELVEKYVTLCRIDENLVIQEVIPGPDRHLVYYIGYFDENSEPLVSFVGVKKRVIPIHFGSASFVVSHYDSRVIDMCTKFMKQVRYQGHVGIELKYDDRDDTYKLIEVNARFGLWDGLPSLCGIDFPLINYRYLHGQTIRKIEKFEDGVRWVSFERDLRAFRKYRSEGDLNAWRWLSSICSGRRDFAVFALDDPIPFILSSYHLLREIIRSRM